MHFDDQSLVPTLRPDFGLGASFFPKTVVKTEIMSILDTKIAAIIKHSKTIAIVGFSANPARASHGVAKFWADRGARVIGVNPGLAGQVFFGEPVVAFVADLPDGLDMIDVFRQSEAVAGIVEEALARFESLPAIWLQLGVQDVAAAAKATARGVDVISNRCPKIEAHRLGI
jgi:uncharacterized protein